MTKNQPGNNETQGDEQFELPEWDPVEMLRSRATASRIDADTALNELRRDKTDEQLLDEFGINVQAFED